MPGEFRCFFASRESSLDAADEVFNHFAFFMDAQDIWADGDSSSDDFKGQLGSPYRRFVRHRHNSVDDLRLSS
ncbi:MAG: hypothetical protein KDD70_14980 [Bdellovibrionales bacterium]|nr:hypothetical protein [Bdellovibrionales bacterium]